MGDFREQLKKIKSEVRQDKPPPVPSPPAATGGGNSSSQAYPKRVAAPAPALKPGKSGAPSKNTSSARNAKPTPKPAPKKKSQGFFRKNPSRPSGPRAGPYIPHAPTPRRISAAAEQSIAPVELQFHPLPKGPLSRQQFFKMPDPWVSEGGNTQYKSVHRGPPVEIFIGLDFGTSYTKAAVGLKDKIYPVTWEGVSKFRPDYLLPSEYSAFSNGSVYVGQHTRAAQDQIQRDLKLPFINSVGTDDAVESASKYLALVLRYIRAWVFHHHGATIGRSPIRWQLNLGAPSDSLEHGKLERIYRLLAASAWQKSLSTEAARLAGPGLEKWREGQSLQDLVDHMICPEFVAQMAGYMKSPQRQRGLHAMVDIGGGTLDIVTFIVHKVDDDDVFPFLVPGVYPLGTHGLIQNRVLGQQASAAAKVDELAPLDEASAFAARTGIDEAFVKERDTAFAQAVGKVVSSVFNITKTRRYRLSDAWTTGVRTFFTGGGSTHPLYRQAVTKARVPSERGLHLTPLPPHRAVDGFSGPPTEYQRISVACGLAQDSLSLGRIRPAKEVEDDRPVEYVRMRERADRDDLYPK
jgi:hypothetical protein